VRPNLTIAIPTVVGREVLFDRLYASLSKQIGENGLQDKVELIYLRDNKEMSIGSKRQKLYEMAKGTFAVQIDDDDGVSDDYVASVNRCIEENPNTDAIGYVEHCSMNGRSALAHHSNRWKDWAEGNFVVDGVTFRYVRTPYHKDPIRTEICLAVGVRDMRYAEDADFARRCKASGLVKSCVDMPMPPKYFYQYTSSGSLFASGKVKR